MKTLKPSTIAKFFTGLSLRVQKALSPSPPSLYVKNWSRSSLVGLTGIAHEFAIIECGFSCDDDILAPITKDLAVRYEKMRERKGLPLLKGKF